MQVIQCGGRKGGRLMACMEDIAIIRERSNGNNEIAWRVRKVRLPSKHHEP